MSKRYTLKPPYPRTREQNVLKTAGTSTYTDKGGTVAPPQRFIVTDTYDIMDDVVTPGYLSLVAKGAIINNPSSRMIREYQCTPGEYSRTYPVKLPSLPNGWWTRWSNFDTVGHAKTGGLIVDTTTWMPSDMENEAVRLAKLQAIASIDEPQHALAEDFFEGGKAMQTLRHPINQLRPIHAKLKRGLSSYDQITNAWRNAQSRGGAFKTNRALHYFKEREQIAHGLSQMWLTARFGYAQLAYTAMHLDTYLRFEVESNMSQKDRVGGRVKASAVQERKHDGGGEKRYSVSAGTIICTVERREYLKARASIIYERKMLDPAMGLTKDLGLRLKDMPKTGWNLLPSSWFVDRFVDVSSMLQGFMNLGDPRLMILSGSVSVERHYEVDYTVTGAISADPANYSLSASGASHLLEKNINRTPWTPSYEDLRPPVTFKSLYDVKQLTDESALVISKLSSILQNHRKF